MPSATRYEVLANLSQDIDDQELKFPGNNLHARRFLYFRFIITYLFHKRIGDAHFAEKVDKIENFWATPGPHLRRSMLVPLAKNISKYHIPQSILEKTTFEDDEHPFPMAYGSLSGTRAAQDVDNTYKAMLASMKAGREKSASEYSTG